MLLPCLLLLLGMVSIFRFCIWSPLFCPSLPILGLFYLMSYVYYHNVRIFCQFLNLHLIQNFFAFLIHMVLQLFLIDKANSSLVILVMIYTSLLLSLLLIFPFFMRCVMSSIVIFVIPLPLVLRIVLASMSFLVCSL